MDSNLVEKIRLINRHCKNNGRPVFRLNSVRRKYLNIFIDDLNSKKINLKNIKNCLCGAGLDLRLASQDRFGLPFFQFICSACGLLSTSPQISPSDLDYYYNKIYHPLIVGIESGKSETYSLSNEQGENIYDFIKTNIENIKSNNLSILEIGCAAGDNLVTIQKELNKIGVKSSLSGSEYQTELGELAKKRGINLIRDIDADVSKYDLVILSHVFEHLPDPPDFLKNIKNKIKINGFLYVEVPGVLNRKMINEFYAGDINDYFVHAHFYNFSLNSLANIICENGFKLIKGNQNIQSIFSPDLANSGDVTTAQKNYAIDNFNFVLDSLYEHQIKRIENYKKYSIKNFKKNLVDLINIYKFRKSKLNGLQLDFDQK